MKRYTKRILAFMLVFALLVSFLPVTSPVMAQGAQTEAAAADATLPEYELITDVLEDKLTNLAGYDPNEIVSYILELEGESLLDAKPIKDDLTMYLASADAEVQRIAEEQAEVQSELAGVASVEITRSYQVVLNGFAVLAPRSAKAELLAIPGVKNVYESTTYDYVEPVNGYVPAQYTSGEKMDADRANAEGYTGKGTVTAILDTGLDVNHEAFQTEPQGALLSKDDISSLVAGSAFQSGTDVDSLYKSLKVPFAYDYADGDYEVLGNNDHGTHVAGSVGASCDAFTGVAPDTQLVIMKVFSDSSSGASSAWIYAALEDAVLLGVDTINMSLGTGSGFSTDTLDDAVYAKVKAAGINLMVSAGNDYSATNDTNLGVDLPLISEPDNGIVGSPSTYAAAMSVASVNEDAIYQTYLLAGDRHILYTDTNDGEMNFVTALDGQTLEYVWVPGYGVEADFADVDVNGKIALVPRGGEVAFTTKEANAKNAGAVALIVYNNEDNADLINMQLDGLLPAVFISKEDGNFLRNQEEKTISISLDYAELIADSTCGYMSDFSSLGVTPDLKLKPEITAPGGYVYSTLPDGTYGVMSGTSMAAPHMAGAASVLCQYVNEAFPEMTNLEKQEYINTVLMNTAEPVLDEYGVAYSPRKQGAGLAQVYDAIHTGAYVTVEGSERPKADLGDSGDGSFSKTVTLTVHNTSDTALSYDLSVLALTAQQTTAVGNDGKTYDVISDYARVMPASELEVTFSENTVTVPAGETKTVTVTLTLTEAGEAALADFVNGTFLDGFIQFTAVEEDGIDLSVPYMGFYGDWGQASVFDDSIYDEEMASVYSSAMAIFSIYTGTGFYLGTNLMADETSELYDVYDADKVAYASRDDYYGRNNYYMLFSLLGLLRAPEKLTYTITDESGAQVYQNVEEHELKSWMTSGGYINYAMGPDPSTGWDPIVEEEDGSLYWAADGDYTLTIDAQVAGTDTVQTTSFPFSIDNEAAKVVETRYYVEDGTPYIDISVTDNNYVMAMQLISGDATTALAEGEVVGEETKGAITTFTYDLTDIQAAGYKTARVAMYDYALNYSESDLFSVVSEYIEADTVTIINQGMTASGNSSPFIIEAMIEPAVAKDKTLTWTSSNPEVASVEALGTTRYDEDADVTYYQALLTPHNVTGEATITATATNGVSGTSTIYVTAVESGNKSIPEDFVIREDGIYEIGDVNQEVIITNNAREVTLIGAKTKDDPYTALRITSQITEGLHLTIENLHIFNDSKTTGLNPILFVGTGNVLTISGTNSFVATSDSSIYVAKAHIGVPKGVELTINGTGSADFLTTNNTNAAAIGGDNANANAGTVIVDGATLNITNQGKGAGIGGATSRSIDKVVINGGTININCQYNEVDMWGMMMGNRDYNGAGIGTGQYAASYYGVTAPTIIINGGTINGTTDTTAPIIGVGSGSDIGADISITGGKLNLQSTYTSDKAAPCIGNGYSAYVAPSITITGGEIVAEAAGRAAAIGSGYRTVAPSITIKGGTITATNTNTEESYPTTAIGPGYGGTAGSVVIAGGSVKAVSAATDGIVTASGIVNTNQETVSLTLLELPGVKSVSVDGVDWKISANHPEDDNLYLWLTEGAHTFVTDPVIAREIPEDFVIREDGIYNIGAVDQEVKITDNAREVTLIGARTAEDPYTGLRFTSDITEGLHLTIENLHIRNEVSGTSSGKNPILFAGTGNTLTVQGTNSFTAPDGIYVGRAHIGVPKGVELTINGEGSADFYMGVLTTGAAIGGDAQNSNAGTVIVDGATLNFTVKGKGAGIGGASSRSIDKVTINGGTLNVNCAYGEADQWGMTMNNLADCGAGIGTGYYVTSYNGSTAPTITINGGAINGTSTTAAPIIGVTQSSDVGATITITGGKLNLESTGSSTDSGACIGSSRSVTAAMYITIRGGEVYAVNNGYSAAIGAGPNAAAGTLKIYGGTITAISTNTDEGKEIPAIGAGYAGTAGTVWICAGSVKAVSASTDGIVSSSAIVNDDLDPVYLNIINAPEVTSVFVDGVDWKVYANHPEDNNLYLWLTEGDHNTVIAGHEHTYGEWVVTAEPDCTKPGTETRYCQCGAFETREIPALGHDYVILDVTEPTCTEEGYTTYICSRCSDSYVGDYVPATGHSYEAVVTPPTCTEEGYTTYTCSSCADSYVADLVPATGHHYEAVVTPPTCETIGYTTHTCSVCGDNYISTVVAATGHHYEAAVTEPTCTAGGYTTYTCATCGSSHIGDLTPAKGHSYTATVTAPTHDKMGYTTYTCACGESYVTNYVDALGHSYTRTVTKEATCTEEGVMTFSCDCGASYTEAIPTAPHQYTALVTAPTCETMGYTTYTCDCGHSYVADYVDALGHACEKTVVPATCLDYGYTVNTCTRCDDSYISQILQPLGHHYEGVVTAPTCTQEGYTTYTCAGCGDSYVDDVTPAYCPSAVFTDLNTTAWYHEYTDAVLDCGYMRGISSTEFAPNAVLTRAQLVTTLYRVAGEPSVEGLENPFTDLTDHWYIDAVIWAANEGIVNGMTESQFAPNQAVTREQAATILYRYAGSPAVEGDDLSDFADGANVSRYAVDAVVWAVKNRYFQGFEDLTLRPRDTLTRAQMAKLLTILAK